jgi:AcrR family transcriptional regulator
VTAVAPQLGGADATTERILDAAYDHMLASGLRRLTVEDVARRAGVARITIYRRFGGKDELVRAVVLREAQRLFAEVDALVGPISSAADRLVEGFVTMLTRVRAHPLVARTLATEPDVALAAVADGGPVIAAAREYLAAHLLRSHRRSRMRAADARAVAEVLVRLGLSFVVVPESAIPLAARRDVRAFARRYLLPLAGL